MNSVSDSSHLVAVGSWLILVEGRHESFTVDSVAQDMLLYLFFIRVPGVIIEGVVRCWGALWKM